MAGRVQKDTPDGLEAALAAINESFGPGSILRMGDAPNPEIEVISTGVLPLDLALGAGGYPRGRIVEIAGPFASGKSTLALHAIAEAQKAGLTCAYVDVEYTLSTEYSGAIGVDIDSLLISQPPNGNEALEIVDRLVKTGEVGLIVIDSVAALVPRAEIEGEMGDAHVGLQARLMSQALRKITAVIGRTNTIVIFLNQIREKVGVMYGSPEVHPGGRALAFYASVILDVRHKETMKHGEIAFANRVKVKVTKNRVGSPFRQTEFDLEYGRGVVREGCVLDLGIDFGVIKKAGAWLSYGETQIGQGREKAKAWLVEHPVECDAIEHKIRELVKDGETT